MYKLKLRHSHHVWTLRQFSYAKKQRAKSKKTKINPLTLIVGTGRLRVHIWALFFALCVTSGTNKYRMLEVERREREKWRWWWELGRRWDFYLLMRNTAWITLSLNMRDRSWTAKFSYSLHEVFMCYLAWEFNNIENNVVQTIRLNLQSNYATSSGQKLIILILDERLPWSNKLLRFILFN